MDQLEIAECVRRWGSTSAISIFDPRVDIFREEGIEGLIGYRSSFRCAVAYGDPVTPRSHALELAAAFKEFCDSKGWAHAYVTGTEWFAKKTIGSLCLTSLEIGEELFISTGDNPGRGAKGRALRNKLNNSKRAGLEIFEYVEDDPIVERQLGGLGRQWLKARKGPQIYLTPVDLFSQRHGKRYFYARENGEVVGVCMLQQMAQQHGWNVQLLMASPKAPIGTTERLVVEVMDVLHSEGELTLFFGVAQTGTLGEIIGLGRVSEWVTRSAFRAARHLFHLDLRRRYLRKFQPNSEPAYLLLSEPRIGIREVGAISRALNVSL